MNSWTQSGKPNDQWQDKEHFVNREPETEPESGNQSEHRSIDSNFWEPFFTHNRKTLRLPGFHPAVYNNGVRATGSFKNSAGKASQHRLRQMTYSGSVADSLRSPELWMLVLRVTGSTRAGDVCLIEFLFCPDVDEIKRLVRGDNLASPIGWIVFISDSFDPRCSARYPRIQRDHRGGRKHDYVFHSFVWLIYSAEVLKDAHTATVQVQSIG